MALSGLHRHYTHKVHTNSQRQIYMYINKNRLKILAREADHTQLTDSEREAATPVKTAASQKQSHP